jgi:hypothetical protein
MAKPFKKIFEKLDQKNYVQTAADQKFVKGHNDRQRNGSDRNSPAPGQRNASTSVYNRSANRQGYAAGDDVKAPQDFSGQDELYTQCPSCGHSYTVKFAK